MVRNIWPALLVWVSMGKYGAKTWSFARRPRQVLSGALKVLVSVAESTVGVQSSPQVRTHNSKHLLLNLIFPTLTADSTWRAFFFFSFLFYLSLTKESRLQPLRALENARAERAAERRSRFGLKVSTAGGVVSETGASFETDDWSWFAYPKLRLETGRWEPHQPAHFPSLWLLLDFF